MDSSFGDTDNKANFKYSQFPFPMMKKRVMYFVFLMLFMNLVFAHEEGEAKEIFPLKNSTAAFIGTASLALFLAVIFIYKNSLKNTHKKIIYSLLVIIISLTTIYFIAATLHINIISETKGPVHWHADFEVWKCGEKISLIEPKGISNKVGTAVLHEHNDNRIHVEGVVVEMGDVDLYNSFKAIGGDLAKGYLMMPTDEGVLEMRNGELCNEKPAKLQVFLYKTTNPDSSKKWIYRQEKLQDFDEYVLSQYSNVPPGDCIIIEFGEERESTDKICTSYTAAMNRGELSGN